MLRVQKKKINFVLREGFSCDGISRNITHGRKFLLRAFKLEFDP